MKHLACIFVMHSCLLLPLAAAADAAAGPPLPATQAPPQHQHPAAAPSPQAGSGETLPPAEQAAGPRLRLEDLEKIALEHNPTLAQAAADVRAAEGRKIQAGAWPNPTFGPVGEDNTTNPTYHGGEIGVFFQQKLISAGKLGLNRGMYGREQAQREAAAAAQRYRVLNSVRSLYYEALGAERLVQVRGELARIAREAVEVSRQLVNVGQADRPDLLEAQIEQQRADLALTQARSAQQRTWRQLAAVVGQPALPPAPLDGDIENTPDLELNSALQKILEQSPEIHAAQAGIERAELALKRARVEKIPDVTVRGGVRHSPFLGLDLQPVGPEGFFEVAIPLPIFDRNKGGVAAARAGLEHAQSEVDRVKLSLQARLAAVYREYADARTAAGAYRGGMLPQARQAYDLYLASYRRMAAAYPQVLIAQRNLSQLQEDYVGALVHVWRSAVEIDGLLLTGGLEEPSAAGRETQPEAGMPYREAAEH